MITHTPQQLAALKATPRVYYLFEFEIGNTTYRFTNSDAVEIYNSQNYLPGFIDVVDEIEITSSPKTNDIDVPINDPNNVISTLLLSQNWMNKPFKFLKVIEDQNGDRILVKNAFEGLKSDISIDAEDNVSTVVISSIWADFEKQSGIKTNPKSQQRYFPNDTAFEHSAKALNKIYWGKDAPANSYSGAAGGGSGAGSVYEIPEIQ